MMMHYYQFNIGDYHSHTQHLDEMEDLAYRRMLDWYYLHESALPDCVEQIARLIRMRTHSDSIANVLNEFFEKNDYGWIQKKAEQEIKKYTERSEKAKASARARWDSSPTKSNANALRPVCEGNANHKPITNNQETRNNKQNKNTTSPSAPKFSEDDYRLAEWMITKLLMDYPDMKKPNADKWADTIRLMRENDNRNHKSMAEIWKFARKDEFWSSNVLSATKFRKQYDTLAAKHKPSARHHAVIQAGEIF